MRKEMNMKRIILLLGTASFWVIFPPSMKAAPYDEVPLRIVSKKAETKAVLPTPKGLTESDPRTFSFSLRNESDKVITAWRFSCIFGANDGHHAIASSEEDDFRAFERMNNEWSPDRGVLFPGVIIDFEVPGNSQIVSGPYGVVACRVDAVVFADGSYAGDATVANEIFERRRREAADALRGIELISAVLSSFGSAEGSLADALGPIREEISAEGNLYSSVLNEAVNAIESTPPCESEVLVDLLAYLQEECKLIGRHLPGKQESEQ